MKCFFFTKKIDDWRRKTSRLSLQQRGIYSELIDWYYCTGGSLPDDIDELCRMLGAIKKAERKDVDKVVHNPVLFTRLDGRLIQNTCEENLFSMTEKSAKGRAAAAARWNKDNDLQHAFALPTDSECNATQYSIPKNQESITHTSVEGQRDNNGGALKKSGRDGVRFHDETIDRAKKMLPRADIYAVIGEWQKSGKEMPNNPDAAFIGWIKVYVRNHPELCRHA